MENAYPKKIVPMTGVGFKEFYEVCFFHIQYYVSQCYLTFKFQNPKNILRNIRKFLASW